MKKSRWSLGLKHLKRDCSEEGKHHMSFEELEKTQLNKLRQMESGTLWSSSDGRHHPLSDSSVGGKRNMKERVKYIKLGMGGDIEGAVNRELAKFDGGEFKGLTVIQSGLAYFGLLVYVPKPVIPTAEVPRDSLRGVAPNLYQAEAPS